MTVHVNHVMIVCVYYFDESLHVCECASVCVCMFIVCFWLLVILSDVSFAYNFINLALFCLCIIIIIIIIILLTMIIHVCTSCRKYIVTGIVSIVHFQLLYLVKHHNLKSSYRSNVIHNTQCVSSK